MNTINTARYEYDFLTHRLAHNSIDRYCSGGCDFNHAVLYALYATPPPFASCPPAVTLTTGSPDRS